MGEPMTSLEPGVTRLITMPQRSVVNLRGLEGDADFLAAIDDAVGVAAPREVNRWNGDNQRFVISLGPDEWLAVAPAGEAGVIEQCLRSARADDPWLSVVDVSHNYTVLALSGPAARTTLSKGCSIDLHQRTFDSGRCAQTLLARTRALLLCCSDSDRFEIWVRNSFARYTADWLQDALAEFH